MLTEKEKKFAKIIHNFTHLLFLIIVFLSIPTGIILIEKYNIEIYTIFERLFIYGLLLLFIVIAILITFLINKSLEKKYRVYHEYMEIRDH